MRYCYWKRSQDKLLLSTNGVVMRKLSEWNPFVVRIEFFLCFFSSTNRTNVRYAFNSIEELQQLHRKYFDNELCHSKWDYAQSFGRAKIKRKIENTPIRALEVYNAIRSGIDVYWMWNEKRYANLKNNEVEVLRKTLRYEIVTPLGVICEQS